jgi:predicted RNA-binding Zn-ribbon protein involved in translation (DUF1610 family)
MTTTESTSRFDCPNCGARYKVVRVEAESVEPGGQLACRSCGAPLEAHDGNTILKYFMVDRPRHAGRPRLVDRRRADHAHADGSSADRPAREAQRQRLG